MADPREVELKLELPFSDAGSAVQDTLAAVAGGVGTTDELRSVYFDTPENTLQHHGFTLRVRTARHGSTQTVKSLQGNRGGLFDRSEWEEEIAGPAPERQAWSKTPVRKVLHKRPVLEPVFETAVERTTWTVSSPNSCVEIAYDRGRLIAGSAVSDIAEIELELKAGPPAELFALARRLATVKGLRIGVRSKSERGYALAAGDRPTFFKAEPIVLSAAMPAEEAFRTILHSCLRQFRLNEAVLVAERSADALHEARVGLRRLRSALSLFADLIADESLPRLKDGLRAASQTLGAARNIDVYLERFVVPEQKRNGSVPGLAAFAADVQALREQAYDSAIATLDGADFRALLLDLVAWTEVGPWATSDDPDRRALRKSTIECCAAQILDKRFRQVRRKGKHLDQLDPAARHRVRIAAKKLRYASEFFASLVKGKAERHRYEAFLRSMKAFQQLLGDLNDLHTGHDIAEDLVLRAGEAKPESFALFAAGHISGEQDERVEALLAEAAATHGQMAGRPKFWNDWR